MAIRIQTDQTLYLYEDEGDTIFPATGNWSILWMYRHESDLNLASLLAVLYGDVAATIYCGAYVGADGVTVTLRGANGGAETTSSQPFVLEVGREYRFSLVHDVTAGTVTLRNDGVPVLSMSFSPAAGDAGFRSLHFAGFGGSPTGHLDSTWARMRIWTAVLTEAEQKAEFRSLTPVRTAGLANDWPMNPGAGRFDPASGTTQAIKIFPTTSIVDGTAFGTGPAELIYRDSESGGDASLSSPTISVPAPTTQTGDLEVLWISAGRLASSGAAPTISTPSGWTARGNGGSVPVVGGAVNTRVHLFTRLAPASNGAVVCNAGVNAVFAYTRLSYSNANSATPFGQAIFGNGGPATSAVLSALTAGRARSLLSSFITQGAAQSITPPSDMVEREDNATSGVSSHDKLQPAAGSSGTKTFTLPSSADFAWGFAELYSAPFTGTLSKTLDALSLAAAGTVASPPITGTLSQTLGALIASAAGTVRASAALSATLGALSASGAGAVRVTGQGAVTLQPLALAGVGQVRAAGALAQTLGDLTLTSTGVVGSTPIVGTAAILLQSLVAAASGQVRVSGGASATLAPATLASAGAVRASGALTSTLGALGLSASGSVRVAGAMATTLGPATLSASGVVGTAPITGGLTVTLAPLAAVATAVARVTGSLARTLGDVTLSAAAGARVTGQLAAVLEAVQVSASGGGVNVGSASIVLDSLALSATGTVLTLSQQPSLFVAYVPTPEIRAAVPAGNFTAFVPADDVAAAVPEGDHIATV